MINEKKVIEKFCGRYPNTMEYMYRIAYDSCPWLSEDSVIIAGSSVLGTILDSNYESDVDLFVNVYRYDRQPYASFIMNTEQYITTNIMEKSLFPPQYTTELGDILDKGLLKRINHRHLCMDGIPTQVNRCILPWYTYGLFSGFLYDKNINRKKIFYEMYGSDVEKNISEDTDVFSWLGGDSSLKHNFPMIILNSFDISAAKCGIILVNKEPRLLLHPDFIKFYKTGKAEVSYDNWEAVYLFRNPTRGEYSILSEYKQHEGASDQKRTLVGSGCARYAGNNDIFNLYVGIENSSVEKFIEKLGVHLFSGTVPENIVPQKEAMISILYEIIKYKKYSDLVPVLLSNLSPSLSRDVKTLLSSLLAWAVKNRNNGVEGPYYRSSLSIIDKISSNIKTDRRVDKYRDRGIEIETDKRSASDIFRSINEAQKGDKYV